MKTLIILSVVLSSMGAFACDQLEAQIIAKVTKVKTDSLTHCTAIVSPESIELYNMNSMCPLDIDEVVQNGITMPLENGHDCEVMVGDELNGILTSKYPTIITIE